MQQDSYGDGRAHRLNWRRRKRSTSGQNIHIPSSLSEPHHLELKAAVTMESGSLLGKNVGNKI